MSGMSAAQKKKAKQKAKKEAGPTAEEEKPAAAKPAGKGKAGGQSAIAKRIQAQQEAKQKE